ncbi:MAG: D-(-)-3-hydroxybutyrate oligomer hydrolase [Xanthomonadales bacterium]|nr:D-(-)-3-hydroxybutyrate oligomer hydrolase [Xanthomonadales bacterium]
MSTAGPLAGLEPYEGALQVSVHREGDELLTAGLGLAGLRADPPAATAEADVVTLRRRAIHANWRGIADLSPAGGLGTLYGALDPVPGREYRAFARLPGKQQPHRVLAQIPDGFDRQRRCLVVAPASGSRGVYGAIAVGGLFGLPRGCAVVYTDKGAGTGVFDLATGIGIGLDGRAAARGSTPLDFDPGLSGEGLAMKHAHSQDHPEADWGRHTLQAVAFGLHALDLAFPEQAPFTPENTTILGVAISNGAAALLKAAERDDGSIFDAVIAGAPNVTVAGGVPLYAYGLEAALYQPCAVAALPTLPAFVSAEALAAGAALRCASLQAAGYPDATPAAARDRLLALGFTAESLQLSGVNLSLDLWRALAATYAQAYARAPADAPVCDYRFVAAGEVPPALRAADGSGIAPMAGVQLVDGMAQGADAGFAGLDCLYRHWQEAGSELGARLRTAVEATRLSGRPGSRVVALLHGIDDGLIPLAFSSAPYQRAAQAAGRDDLRLYTLPGVQHFDAFLAHPTLAARRPLLPYVLDIAGRALAGIPLPPSQTVAGSARSGVLDAAQLGRFVE